MFRLQFRELFKAALCMLLIPLALPASIPPRVISMQPAAHTVMPGLLPEITVRFDAPIDPASVHSHSFAVFGRWAGVCPGEYEFLDNNQQIRFLPRRAFSGGELITVSISKEVRNANGETMAKGFAWSFVTASRPGSFELRESRRISVRRPGEGQIRTYGAYAGDLNGDGYHDFTVPNEDANDIRVFMNDGAGSYSTIFRVFPLPANSTPSTNEGADFNGDGLLDFALGNIRSGTAGVFIGDGQGGFATPKIYSTGAGTRGLGVLDLNGDGAPDLVTANRGASTVTKLLNAGDGTFTVSAVPETGARGETSCAIADANEDGVMDAFIGSFESGEMVVLLGDGNGNLVFSTRVKCGGDAWMAAAGDVDGDRHVDVVAAHANQRKFAVLRGDGTGQLGEAQVFDTGFFPLAIDLGDVDGDGDLDLATSNYASANFILFQNDGAGRFSPRKTLPASTAGSCAVLHDRDRDGDLDMTGIDEEDDLLFLFENPGPGTAVDELPASPGTFELFQSYPNPVIAGGHHLEHFADQIVVPFQLQQPARVRLEIIDLRGVVVRILLNEERSVGRHHVQSSLRNLPPGVYFYRLQANGISATRRLVVLAR
ncbi:MAG: FG-GAP-like repeat-containing protein [bacterium]